MHYNYPPKSILDTNGYDYVDLGLPTGALWATMNIGALKPSDYGLYFQWGDTQGYTSSQVGTGSGQKAFTWADYKFSINGSGSNFSKYTASGATLELEDDAAHVNMGGDWHMPSPTQFQELIDNTTTAWTTSNGVSGMTFTSNKDTSKSIFIPTANYAPHLYVGGGYVWSNKSQGSNAIILHFDSSILEVVGAFSQRNWGCSVRGVAG